jgi:hypothetical protein
MHQDLDVSHIQNQTSNGACFNRVQRLRAAEKSRNEWVIGKLAGRWQGRSVATGGERVQGFCL